MQLPLVRILTAVLLAALAVPAAAERNLVFAARYYTPPGGRETSRFHLYRINPDGSSLTPLTQGAHDDRDPRWSPDGRWVAFTRDRNQLCAIRAAGGPVCVLASSTYDDDKFTGAYIDFDAAHWLPGSRRLILPSGTTGTPTRLIDVPSGRAESLPMALIDSVPSPYGARVYTVGGDGVPCVASASWSKRVPLGAALRYAAWMSPNIVAGTVESEGDASDDLAACDAGSGKKLWEREVSLTPPTSSDLGLAFRGTIAIPGDPAHLILASDVSSSTVRPDNDYYRVTTKTAKAALWLPQTQFLVFAPDGRRYAAAPAKTLANYGPIHNGRQPQVWTSELRVGASATDPRPRAIVRGLVWVIGADWRK